MTSKMLYWFKSYSNISNFSNAPNFFYCLITPIYKGQKSKVNSLNYKKNPERKVVKVHWSQKLQSCLRNGWKLIYGSSSGEYNGHIFVEYNHHILVRYNRHILVVFNQYILVRYNQYILVGYNPHLLVGYNRRIPFLVRATEKIKTVLEPKIPQK